MARSRGFRGTYCFLVPYLVCFLWWEFSVVLLQHSSIIGLIRTCVAYFLLLFALPVLAFGLALMLLIQMAKWFLELQLTKVVVTLALCAVPVSLRLWTRFSLSILDVLRSLTHGGAVKLILVCVSMGILFFGMYVYHSEGLKAYNSTLTWGQYSQLCGPPAWQSRGMAQTQMFCSHLEGHRVTWNGRFKQMRLADMENGPQSVINVLPVFMGDWLRCLYGEAYPKCETRNATPVNATPVHATLVNATPVNATPVHATPVNAAPVNATPVHATPVNATLVNAAPPPLPQGSPVVLRTQEEEELCQMKAVAKHACHVKRFDSFLFEVTVGQVPGEGGGALDPTHDIVLKASHEFKQVLLNLEPGNVVEFSTKLEGGLGAKAPSFELRAIHCLDCTASPLAGGRQVKLERNWRRNTLEAVKFAFDFFFSPLLFAKINV